MIHPNQKDNTETETRQKKHTYTDLHHFSDFSRAPPLQQVSIRKCHVCSLAGLATGRKGRVKMTHLPHHRSSTITPLRCSGGYQSGPSCPAYRPPTCGSINAKLLSIAAPWASSDCRRAKSSPPTIPHCLGPGVRNRCSSPPATEL